MIGVKKGERIMADSNITKRALSNALREAMQEIPFQKISITDICSRCDMNRKSFYYHFKDKYDLVIWIFDTEFGIIADKFSKASKWEYLTALCRYFDENRDFYRRAIKISGQNSFSSHLHCIIEDVISDEFDKAFGKDVTKDFQVCFFTDGFVCAIERWLLQKDPVTPENFMGQIQSILEMVAEKLYCGNNK